MEELQIHEAIVHNDRDTARGNFLEQVSDGLVTAPSAVVAARTENCGAVGASIHAVAHLRGVFSDLNSTAVRTF